MRLLACKLLADENIHPIVVDFLRMQGCDVRDVFNLALAGSPDALILDHAKKDDRIVLTHDRDFGRLAVLGRQPIIGIVYLRPGHIGPQFTIDMLQAMNAREFDLRPPFILVAYRRESHLRLRLRRW